MIMKKWFLFFLVIVLLFSNPFGVYAQDQNPSAPVYIVQSGDTMYTIALRFNVPLSELITANPSINPDLLQTGMEVVIPGLEGVSGVLSTEAIPLGMGLDDLARFRNVSRDLLIRLNKITSPAEVYAGSNLVVPEKEAQIYHEGLGRLSPQKSLLQVAVEKNLNPWSIALSHQQLSTQTVLSGEMLYSLSSEKAPTPNPLMPIVQSIVLSPLPLVQGRTVVITVQTTQPVEISGSLNDRALGFFENRKNELVAIQGIHAMANPGLIPFSLQVKTSDGNTLSFQQEIILMSGYYPQDPPLSVDPATIAPENTKPEDDLIREIVSKVTPEKLWDGMFALPVDEPYCIRSGFGNRRSYNGSPYTYFHTGLDYGVCANLNIRAPAAGVVVYTGDLTVRGKSTIIDHGWGVFSGFWHQQEILVNVGDKVEPGQLIGLIGGTGRVTGPHLHWEVWANGVQVNPQQWLEQSFP